MCRSLPNDVRCTKLLRFPANTKDVYQADSIFTGDRSEAFIIKTACDSCVRANSLISLNMKNGQMNLDLKYGDLEAEISKESALVVKSGTEEFKLENDSSKAGAPAKSKSNLKVSQQKCELKARLGPSEIKPSMQPSSSRLRRFPFHKPERSKWFRPKEFLTLLIQKQTLCA